MKIFKQLGIIAIFAALGFAYYKFIGCRSGACPITSNPWISTGYGALIGFILTLNFSKNKDRQPKEKA